MKKVLVVVDMQNDFVDGVLGTPEARAIVPRVVEKVKEARMNYVPIIFTRDAHGEETYMESEEGKNLPVPHCIKWTHGYDLVEAVSNAFRGFPFYTYECQHEFDADSALTYGIAIIDKPTFGSTRLGELVRRWEYDEVEVIGLCTDICVISNALLIKAFSPDTHVVVDASCCAGVTPESHRTALAAMKACQIEVRGE